MSESRKPGIRYRLMVVAVSFLFSIMMFEIVANVIGNFVFALAVLISGTSAPSVTLIYDWDSNLGTETS